MENPIEPEDVIAHYAASEPVPETPHHRQLDGSYEHPARTLDTLFADAFAQHPCD